VRVRMTPHRFRHTLATDLMKQPERNIHLTKSLLNHSNIATTMNYIEVDYGHMRTVLHERSLAQGALSRVRRVDPSGTTPTSTTTLPPAQTRLPSPESAHPKPKKLQPPQHRPIAEFNSDRPSRSTGASILQRALEFASAQLHRDSVTSATDGQTDQLDQNLMLTLMASGLGVGRFRKSTSTERSMGITSFSRASP